MSAETPNQRLIDGMITNTSITWTQSVMTIEHRIDISACAALSILALIALGFSFLVFGKDGCFVSGLIIAISVLLGIIIIIPYRYEFDKERREIKCKWGGLLGAVIGKNGKTYSLDDVAYIEIEDIPSRYRYHDSFRVEMVFQNRDEIDLPSERSLASSMEYANIYKDFLELQTPIRGRYTATAF